MKKHLPSLNQLSFACGIASVVGFFRNSSFVTEHVDHGTLTHLQVPWYIAAAAFAGFVAGIASHIVKNDAPNPQAKVLARLGIVVSAFGLLLSTFQLNSSHIG